jgi:hypothetical protein
MGTVKVYRSIQTAALLLGSLLFLALFRVPANPYIAFGLTGSVAGFVWTAWSLKRATIVVAGALAYAGLYRFMGGPVDHYPGWWLAYPGGLLGLAAVMVAMLRWFWALGDPSVLKRGVVMLAAIPALCAVSSIAVGSAIKFTPYTYDYTLYAFDQSLGAPAFVLGRFMSGHPALFLTCSVVYNALPLWAAIAWMLVTAYPPRRVWHAQACFIALGAIGFLLYQLCPAAGPAYRFAGLFPWTEPPPATLPMGAAILDPCARNAMPSLHIAWALLFVFVSLEWKWPFRVASIGITLATLAAILGSGEHYLVDAVVALPLLLSLLAAVMPSLSRPVRIWCCGGGGLLTIAWLLGLRFGVALALTDATRVAVSVATAAIGITGMIMLHRLSLPPLASIRETGPAVTGFEHVAATFSEPEPS